MIKFTIKDFDTGQSRTQWGDVGTLERELLNLPNAHVNPGMTVHQMVDAINAEGFYEVDVEPDEERPEDHRLHENYHEADQGDDPWVRGG